jgi:DNA-binding Lrp family transcriptional regulator
MDDKDYQIIRVLQRDGRITNAELAVRVNLSPSPCLRRVRLLEEGGVIRGYTALVDQAAFGLPVTVFVQIHLSPHSTEAARAFETRIRGIEEVLDCHLMTGDADYLLRVVVPSLEAYERFIRERIHPIPNIASINTSFAYGMVKQERVFPALRG